MSTVDVHAHVLLPELDEAVAGRPGHAESRELDARRNGTEALAVNRRMIGERLPLLTDPARRLAAMDAAGVDVQLVSPSPSHYHHWAGPGLAEELCRRAGEGTAAHCATAPDRLVGLGLAPLQHPVLMARSLEDALARGLVGVEISSHAPGSGAAPPVELSDPRLAEFWDLAERAGALVFLHPFGCTLDERLDRWYLSNSVGQPVENAVALSHLIFSGVLDRHPELRLIAAHGGGYLPAHLGRADHAWRTRPDARAGCAREPSAYLRNLYFDSLVHDPFALRELVRAAGAGRVLLGSDFPFDMGTGDPLGALRAAEVSEPDFHAIRGGNAAALLPIRGGTP
ncbi:amidohydrolase family protein [Saccharopolyspora gloriosae]|uniref:amidohydrolase family protein n=1 Tax=Saccharopolyspora gloriosae TaxID=455344 RepID=UPI001FB7CCCB|nr:amidohydrolase family protein [Saccharopolyspora gloriosae]